jgi:hypothetical protein
MDVHRSYQTSVRPCLWLLVATLCIALFSSCDKEYSCEGCYSNPGADTVITDSTLFTDFTINGQRSLHISGQKSYSAYYTSGIGSSTSTSFVSGVAFNGLLAPNQRNFLEFWRGMLPFTPPSPSEAEQMAFFRPGSYPFVPQQLVSNGVVLTWVDGTGKKWRTDWGSGDQTGSFFNLLRNDPVIENGLLLGIHLFAEFNCTLYDLAGNAVRLTNGRFRLPVWI